LKCLLPEKYGQENRPTSMNVTINVDGKALEAIARRQEVIDIEPISENATTP